MPLWKRSSPMARKVREKKWVGPSTSCLTSGRIRISSRALSDGTRPSRSPSDALFELFVLRFIRIERSSNGRTTDSGSVYLGSNPGRSAASQNDAALLRVRAFSGRPPEAPDIRPHRLVVRTSASHAGNRGSTPLGVAGFLAVSSLPCPMACPMGSDPVGATASPVGAVSVLSRSRARPLP